MADAKLSALTTGAAVAATDLFYSAQDAGGGSFNQVKQAASAVRTYMGTTIVVANEATDTTCFPVFVTAATGELGLKTNADLAFNSSTGSLTLGGQLSFGSVLAASATDISNHIALYGGTWGFGISSGQLNIVAGGVAIASVTSAAFNLGGNLAVIKATPQIFVDKAAAGQAAIIGGKTAGVLRWQMHMGSTAAESGGDVGSDFILQRISDAGTNLGNAITVTRSTGIAAFSASPTAPTPTAGDSTTKLATTAFVQSAVLNDARPQRFISGAAGAIAYAATDQLITLGVTSGAGMTYALPTAATRNTATLGLPITFKDVTGCLSGHNLTINCSETIDGLAAPLVLTNNFAGVTLWPRTDGAGGWFML